MNGEYQRRLPGGGGALTESSRMHRTQFRKGERGMRDTGLEIAEDGKSGETHVGQHEPSLEMGWGGKWQEDKMRNHKILRVYTE